MAKQTSVESRTYKVRLEGLTPLLMHNANIAWADKMKVWQADPANREGSVAGDDRSPAWRWIGNMYIENHQIVIPSDNLMTVLREGGKRCPTGKRGATFKSQTQSGIVVNEVAWPLLVHDKMVNTFEIEALQETRVAFSEHEALVKKLGFELFLKWAKIGMAKNIRVRPRFDVWACEGTLTVFDPEITTDVLSNIITFAGKYAGIGDWRPSSPKSPGSWGKFTAQIKLQ